MGICILLIQIITEISHTEQAAAHQLHIIIMLIIMQIKHQASITARIITLITVTEFLPLRRFAPEKWRQKGSHFSVDVSASIGLALVLR